MNAFAGKAVCLVVVVVATGALIATCVDQEDDSPPTETSVNEQPVTSCVGSGAGVCPAAVNASTGSVARIFAGGTSATDESLLMEDSITKEAYRYVSGTSWVRVGTRARSYAFAGSQLYRIAGDARADKLLTAADNWDRVGIDPATALVAVGSTLFAVDRAGALWSYGGGFAWTLVDAGGLEFVATSGTLYKRTATATYKYNGTPLSWSQIGATSVSRIYAGGGFVFAKNSAGHLLRWAKTGTVWDDLGASSIQNITGTATDAYGVLGGAIVKYNSATRSWLTVRPGSDARDLVASATHVFTITSAGAVLRLESTGTWTNVSCSGAIAQTGCANGCEPGPPATGTVPNYPDSYHVVQNSPSNTRYDVVTQHNNNARTGAVRSETILTPTSVATGGFGLLRSIPVSGRIFAQPLYVEQAAVVCQGTLKTANVAFVATLNNIVYAIDVDQGSICWQSAALGCPQLAFSPGCASGDVRLDYACNANFDFGHEGGIKVGIVSTPVVDIAKSILYTVARVRDGNDKRGRYFLHAINTRTGQLVSRTEIVADTLNGHQDCNGRAFRPSIVTQRAGLLLESNKLFVGFAGNSGEATQNDYHGTVVGFDVVDPAHPQSLVNSFCATPSPDRHPKTGGGVWMAGSGPASDGASVYFTTGNGAYPVTNGDYDTTAIPDAPVATTPPTLPDSFVRVPLSLAAASTTGYTDARTVTQIYPGGVPYYAPKLSYVVPPGVPVQRSIFWGRERSDADFGSGGVLLLGNRLIGGGKDGRLYVIDTTTSPLTRVRDFQAAVNYYSEWETYDYITQYHNGPHIHGGPAAWDARPNSPYIYVYLWSEKDNLKRLRFNPATGDFEAADRVDATPVRPFPTAHGDIASGAPRAMPGGMLSVSSNGAADGIVWAVVQEPNKTCTMVTSPVKRVVVDVPPTAGTDLHGCTVLEGYTPGRLFAFAAEADASNRLRRLWGDTNASAPNNFIPGYAKHAPPTVAHGRILIAAADDVNGVPTPALRVYGLNSGRPSQKIKDELSVDDIALSGTAGWTTIPVAASNGNGSFTITNDSQPTFASWAAGPGVVKLAGDFNGDGRTDILLTGAGGWTTLPLARSNGNGTFVVSNASSPSFAFWASATAASKLVGDFDNDGRADVMLLGEPSWHTIPMAYSNGDGTFAVTNADASAPLNFTFWATSPTASRVVGDFNGDGRSDVALVGDASGHTVPMARATSVRGAFSVTNQEAGNMCCQISPGGAVPCSLTCNFAFWATSPTASKLTGDFNGDGRTDIALVGDPSWTSIPVAFSVGDGSFRFSNAPLPTFTVNFGALAANARVRLVGDFNGDGRADVALLKNVGAVIPVAFSNGDGSFRVTVFSAPGFAGWADTPGATPIVGDFDHDGSADIALTGGAGWVSVPVALSNGEGSFRVVNSTNVANFAGWASTGAPRLPGNYR